MLQTIEQQSNFHTIIVAFVIIKKSSAFRQQNYNNGDKKQPQPMSIVFYDKDCKPKEP